MAQWIMQSTESACYSPVDTEKSFSSDYGSELEIKIDKCVSTESVCYSPLEIEESFSSDGECSSVQIKDCINGKSDRYIQQMIKEACSIIEKGKKRKEEKSMKRTSDDIEIELYIYSGRRNPTFYMPQSHSQYNDIKSWFSSKETNVSKKGLGYCGFSLKLRTNTLHIMSDSVTETTLLEIMCEEEMISKEVETYIRECIKGNRCTAPIHRRTVGQDVKK